MDHLIALTFDGVATAADALRSMRQLEKSADLDLADTATLARDGSGKVQTHNELSGGMEKGLVAGGILGAIVGFAFPIAGVLLGAGGGALAARFLKTGIDPGCAREVGAALQPGESALVLMVRQWTPELVYSALRPYHPRVYQTTLSPKLEQELRQALQH